MDCVSIYPLSLDYQNLLIRCGTRSSYAVDVKIVGTQIVSGRRGRIRLDPDRECCRSS